MSDVRLIDANATKEKLAFAIEPLVGYAADIIRNDALLDAIKIVDSMPTIDAQLVKHGKWERTDMFVKCSECGVELLDDAFFGIHVFDDGYMPFCPNCGARMDGDADEQ